MYTSVLLCVYTRSECGPTCQVDAIVMLTWSKVCITKRYRNVYRKFYPKAIVDVNRIILLTGQICRQSDQLSRSTGQICR